MKQFINLLVVSLILVPTLGWSQVMTDFAGMIPRGETRPPATDLVVDGKVLTPEQVVTLKHQGQDVSLLSPVESDLWKDQPEVVQASELGFQASGESFKFVSNVIGIIGNHRFTVSRVDGTGVVRNYTISISRQSQNVLLRKALLRKLGYRVPPVQRLSQFKLQFNGAFSRKTFTEQLHKNAGDPNRWVISKPDEASSELMIQDALIYDNESNLYNLSAGLVPSEVVLGRRVMNALLVPFHLVDIPESVNFFNWNSSKITNGVAYLPYDWAESFSPSYDDARWMTRRLLKLTRQDFAEVVAAAQYPPEVAALALEKIISRRNALPALFEIQAAAIPFNAEISMGEALVKGKLKHKDPWPGHGARFTFGDPTTPLSAGQIRSLFKSRAVSSLLDNLASQFNTKILPRTDIAKFMQEKQIDLSKKRLMEFLKTGEVKKTPFGIWATPTIGGNLIVSRDVVTGPYMGTDNLVQKVDSIGYSMDAGVFIGTHGLPSGIQVSGQAKLYISRIYSHIKPIKKDIRTGVNEPLKKTIVPLLTRDLIDALDPIAGLQTKEIDEATMKKITAALDEFKSGFGIGESFLVQDSVGGMLGAGLGAELAPNIEIQAKLADSQINIRRLHIYRRDEHTFQVYYTPGDYNFLELSISLKAVIPVLNISMSRKAGSAETSFFSMNFDPETATGEDMISNARSLQRLFITNNVESLEATIKPFKIKHKFKETASQGRFLMARWLGQRTQDLIEATHPDGEKKQFVYASQAKVEGVDYESLSIDLINSALEQLVDDDIFVDSPKSSNPGTSVGGKSTTRQASFEAELSPDTSKPAFAESYVSVNYNWRGWSISRADMLKLMKNISDKYAFQFFPENALNTTKKLQLYSLDLNMSIYQSGIDKLAQVSNKTFEEILVREGKWTRFPEVYFCGGNSLGCGEREGIREKSERLMRQFFSAKKSFIEKQQKRDFLGAARAGISMVSAAEIVLSPTSFIELIGGVQNAFIQARLNGFRQGDEAAEDILISSTLGEIGSRKMTGPLRYVQSRLEMSEGEFFLYWLLNRP